MKSPIIDNSDKIIYYDQTGKILLEERILTTSHPHTYFALRAKKDKVIKLNNQDYAVVHMTLDATSNAYGLTIETTHLKLIPFIDGQHY